jgi:DNA polymerase-3 subunit delta'
MRFAEIEAQEIAVRTLKSSVAKGTVPHAYLFAGPRGSGKSTTAIAFASALNCVDRTPDGDSCGECQSCLRIAAGQDADVRVIAPDGNQTKIEQMQEMIHELGFAPLSGRYKVFIIEQADTLNSASENCILKILEEPPAYGVLILLTRNVNSLLPTIRSRCHLVRFKRAERRETEAALAKRGVAENEARIIAACSQGNIGMAIRISSDEKWMDDRRRVLDLLSSWSDGPSIGGLRAAETLREMARPPKNNPEGRTLVKNLTETLDLFLTWYSDLLRLSIMGDDAEITNADYAEILRDQSARYTTTHLRACIRSIMETRHYLEGNISPQLALENLLFRLHPNI